MNNFKNVPDVFYIVTDAVTIGSRMKIGLLGEQSETKSGKWDRGFDQLKITTPGPGFSKILKCSLKLNL